MANDRRSWASWVIPLVAAVLGLAGGLAGAYLGARATVTTQRDEARDNRLAEARSKRARVYSDFLSAADRYAGATRRLRAAPERWVGSYKRRYKGFYDGCLDGNKKQCRQLRPVLRVLRACVQRRGKRCRDYRQASTDFLNARPRFQGALNDVYVYGSTRGVQAARKVAGALPPSLYRPGTFRFEGDVPQREFESGYNAVLDTMCREVSAVPRATC
jgi:hypothetical protein